MENRWTDVLGLWCEPLQKDQIRRKSVQSVPSFREEGFTLRCAVEIPFGSVSFQFLLHFYLLHAHFRHSEKSNYFHNPYPIFLLLVDSHELLLFSYFSSLSRSWKWMLTLSLYSTNSLLWLTYSSWIFPNLQL